MSEQQPRHHEQLKPIESSVEHAAKHYERELTTAEKQHGNKEHIDKINETIEKHAISGKEQSAGEKETPKSHHPVIVNKQLKDMAFSRAMTRTRKKLSPVSRGFSKVIHNSFVDQSSEYVGKTIARPQAMMWGALFAFIGSSALLWITRHYGYEYNYLAVILLFVGGAIAGSLLEGLLHVVRKRKN